MENQAHSTDLREQARASLDAKGLAERELGAGIECPPWRHLLFGLMMGGLIVTPALPLMARLPLLAGILCGVGLIIRSDRKRLGVFINGYRRGRTRIVTLGILAFELGLYGLSVNRGDFHGDRLTPLLLGIVGVLVGHVGSVLWQRIFLRELGAR